MSSPSVSVPIHWFEVTEFGDFAFVVTPLAELHPAAYTSGDSLLMVKTDKPETKTKKRANLIKKDLFKK